MQTRILVTGATGNQGGAVLQALFDLKDDRFQVLGLTRNPDSPSARNLLAKHKSLQLISGDYDKPTAIFVACAGRVDKIFFMSTPPGFPPNADIEEQQGKALIDAAIAHGVNHFMQTTVDRGPQSDTNSTGVPHYISKFNIERHLIQRTNEQQGRISYTMLRPSVFMENFSGGPMAKLLATAMRDALPSDYRVQMVSVKDIGWYGAQALVRSSEDRYKNRSISLAGDELSFTDMERTYEEVCGEPLPTTYSVLSWAVSLLIRGLPLTLRSFQKDGFSAQIPELRTVNPGMRTFRAWLVERQSKAT